MIIGLYLSEDMMNDNRYMFSFPEMDQITLMVKMLGVPSESMLRNLDASVSSSDSACAQFFTAILA